MKSPSLFYASVLAVTALMFPSRSLAAEPPLALADDVAAVAPQQNVPAKAQDVEDKAEQVAKRFGVGIQGGVGLDPEIIDIGAHATFGPIFHRGITFRPGVEFGFGEVTTMFAVNLDVLYQLPGATRSTRWTPYVGAGPNFGLSHRGVSSADLSPSNDVNRFNFGDTTFDAGINFIAGARNRNGLFVEMKATAYGVSNVRLLAGFNF
jgi:hypothetical protein